jgi:hypothetical protein
MPINGRTSTCTWLYSSSYSYIGYQTKNVREVTSDIYKFCNSHLLHFPDPYVKYWYIEIMYRTPLEILNRVYLLTVYSIYLYMM